MGVSSGTSSTSSTSAASGASGSECMCCSYKQYDHMPYVRIAVTDTGAGMSSDTIRRLFSDEKQFAESSNGQGGGGSGFGLRITKGMVDLHDGRVGVSSNGVGKGSTFYVELPLFMLEHNNDSRSGNGSGNPICTCSVDTSGLISN